MTLMPIEIAQAKLAELIESLGAGDEVILTRNQKPVAKLVGQNPVESGPRKPGSALGKLHVLAEDDQHLQDFEPYMP